MKAEFDKAMPVIVTALNGHPMPIARADVKFVRADGIESEQGKTAIFFHDASRQPLYVSEEIKEVLRLLNGTPSAEKMQAFREDVGKMMGIPAESVMASEIGRKHMDELVMDHCKEQGADGYYFNYSRRGIYTNAKAKPSGDEGGNDGMELQLTPSRARYEEISRRNLERLQRGRGGRGRDRDGGDFSL